MRSAAGIGGWFGAREPRGSVDEGAGQSQSPQAEAVSGGHKGLSHGPKSYWEQKAWQAGALISEAT